MTNDEKQLALVFTNFKEEFAATFDQRVGIVEEKLRYTLDLFAGGEQVVAASEGMSFNEGTGG